MKESYVLTIVIPSYNTSKFMDETLPYFNHEKLYSDLEVLIISDGSTDDTVIHAKKYAEVNPCIKVIEKDNGGHGSVINRGILEAQGKYFKIVDGDDWVFTENLVKFVERIKNVDADLILNPYMTMDISKSNKTKLVGEKSLKEETVLPEDAFELIDTCSIHGYTIKTSILRENNIRLTEKCYYDDFQYTFYPLPYVRSILYVNYPLINYVIGQKQQSVSDANVYKNRAMHEKIVFDSIEYYSSNKTNMTDIVRNFCHSELTRICKSGINIYIRNYTEKHAFDEMKEYVNKIKSSEKNVYNKLITGGYSKIVSNKIIFLLCGIVYRFKRKFF